MIYYDIHNHYFHTIFITQAKLLNICYRVIILFREILKFIRYDCNKVIFYALFISKNIKKNGRVEVKIDLATF